MYDSLKEVLEVYCKFRPEIGYVQGMSYLVCVLLLYMDEYNAFVCLANMLNQGHFYSFFRMNTVEVLFCLVFLTVTNSCVCRLRNMWSVLKF